MIIIYYVIAVLNNDPLYQLIHSQTHCRKGAHFICILGCYRRVYVHCSVLLSTGLFHVPAKVIIQDGISHHPESIIVLEHGV